MLDALYSILSILIILLIVLEFFYFSEALNNIKFKNTILDLDTEKSYTLKDIESIFMNTNNIQSINEYNIIKIEKYIKQIKGNLLDKNTKYYEYTFFISYIKNTLRKREYSNNKEKLLKILSSILEEIIKEKQFFGLNTREKKIFQDLITSNYLKENDIGKLEELKVIITDRYQELLKEYEKSNKNAESSKKYARISIIFTLISLAPYFNKFFVWLGVIK